MSLSYFQMDAKSAASQNVAAMIAAGSARMAKLTEKKVAPPFVDEPIFYFVNSGVAIIEVGAEGRDGMQNLGEGWLFRGVWVPRGVPVAWMGSPTAELAVFVGEHFLDKLFSPSLPEQILQPVEKEG